MAVDCITCAIAGAADDITAVRFVRLIETGEIRMPLELKGLKANMRRLQSTVEELNSLAAAGVEKGDRLKSHLGDIRDQIGDHVDDIEFAASVLGNSSGGSGESVEKPKEPAVPEQPPPLPPNPEAPQARQAVGQAGGFPQGSPGQVRTADETLK